MLPRSRQIRAVRHDVAILAAVRDWRVPAYPTLVEAAEVYPRTSTAAGRLHRSSPPASARGAGFVSSGFSPRCAGARRHPPAGPASRWPAA